MRRLARHLFTLCSAVSLLLCVALCALWVRSHSWKDIVGAGTYWGTEAARGQRELSGSSNSGALRINLNTFRFQYRTVAAEPGPDADGWGPFDAFSIRAEPDLPLAGFDRWGFGLGWARTVNEFSDDVETRRYYGLRVPHWFLAIMLLALPARWFSARRRTVAGIGLCPSCGYDLRASPGRCPECGTLPKR